MNTKLKEVFRGKVLNKAHTINIGVDRQGRPQEQASREPASGTAATGGAARAGAEFDHQAWPTSIIILGEQTQTFQLSPSLMFCPDTSPESRRQ